MKKFKLKSFWLDVFLYSFFIFSLELIFRVISKLTLLDFGVLRIFLSCLFLGFFLEFLFSFIQNKTVRKWIFGVFFLFITVYAWIQIGFRNFLGIYMSIGTSSQAGAVISYLKEFFASYQLEYYSIFFPCFLYFYYIIVGKTKEVEKSFRVGLKSFLGLFVTGVIYALTLFLPFFQNPLQLVENYKVFLSPINSSVAVSQFGSTIFGMIDVRQSLFPIHLLDDVDLVEQSSHERNIDDSMWLKLIEEETNSVQNTLNRYFISREISEPNEYTGYFKDKNLIVVMLESVNNIVLNEEYFPNFHKILEHSWYWENNYSPRNACPTGDNEFSTLTSLYPINVSCTVNTYPNNYYFEAIFNQFKKENYHATSYHDLDSYYYPRDIYHYNMGSENYYDGNRLGISFDSSIYYEWPSDVELMEHATSLFTQDEPFMAWITTVSAHAPYDHDSVLGEKYYSLFDDTDYSPELKRYLSKLKVTDDSLGVLISELEKKGVLDDTVIVMFGDHYPYSLSDENIEKMVSYDLNEFYERERVPFLIYNNKLSPKTFQENTFYMNILPTLLNLFDIEYDPRLYLGEDLFSDDFSGRVVFADGSWQDDVARYNAIDSKIEYFGDKTYTEEEIRKINTEIYQKKEMSKLAIVNNYFDYLDTARKQLKEKENKDE